MIRISKLLCAGALLLFFNAGTIISAQNTPVLLEAEDGTLGGDFRIVDTLGIQAVTITTNSSAYNPENDNRIITFNITFPDTGSYHLFAHILVGKNTYNDDSYFYGNGFGSKTSNLDSDWIFANGLAGVGYNIATDLVYGAGTVQSGSWKWLDMSRFSGGRSFHIGEGELTQTFQIGAREDGFYIDKLIFGKSSLYFTVANLNNGEAGSEVDPNSIPPGTPLADGQDKFLGSGWDYIQAPFFAGLWNQSTPGNAGKWGSVEYTRNAMNWSVLDSTYNVAKRFHMLFKEHTLIWGAQQPPWIGDLDSATQRAEIEQWFAALAGRYPEIDLIDVVNEPIHNAPNGMVPWGTTTPNVDYAQALGGAGETGWDWIITAFRLARQYFPDAKLIINEYSVINSYSTTKTYIEIINLLKAENLIDGIGEQGHAFTTAGTPSDTLLANLNRLAETGIPLYITELDIDGLTDLSQLKEYQRVFPLFWEHPSIAGVTLWGYRYGVWRQDEKAYIIDENDVDRPAMTWLKAYVNDTLVYAGSVEISGESSSTADTIFVGDQLQLSASILPLNTTIPRVAWGVNFTVLASIDQEGVLTATKAGIVTAKATAWDGSGVYGTRTVVILNKLAETLEISAAGDADSLFVDESLQFTAVISPENTTDKTLTWSVNPSELATISSDGLLSPKASGMVKVKATANDGSGIADSLEIKIVNRLVQSISVSSADDSDSLYINETLQMSAMVLPENATDPSYTWSVSPQGLASVSSDGLLTGLEEGKVNVTATANDASGVSGSMEITIVRFLGTENSETRHLTLYPNPVKNGKLTVYGISDRDRLEVYNILGKKVMEMKLHNEATIVLDIKLKTGIYMLRVSNTGSYAVKKFTVE